MKSLRKSLHRETHRLQISTPLPLAPAPKAPLAPQKVIRAIASASPASPQQLPFQKGDFFYVTADPGADSPWYEAHNPVTGARGLVPKNMFEEFSKNPSSHLSIGPTSPTSPATASKGRTRVFYAVVLHDFVAERADELDAKAGDPISVVAQSNREWFVAKPIGRLGRPGLIPASFVELRDPASNLPIDDVDALIDCGDLPKVEDWKKAMINYKQNSISLGVIEDSQLPVPNSPYTQTNAPPLPIPLTASPPTSTSALRPPSPALLPDGILLSAEVVSFHYEGEEYWFRVDAVFQPYDPHDPHVLPKAKQLVLFRSYNHFYDFQVGLLGAFPGEAGREPGLNRILPFMPGPADKVDDEITAVRRVELDQYIRKLCALNSVGASYILEHQLIRNFLSPGSGDMENDIEPRYDEISALFSDGGDQDAAGVAQGELVTQEFEEEVRDTLGEMKLTDREDRSDGSDYGEDHTHPPHTFRNTHQRSDTLSSIRKAEHQNGEKLSFHGERSNGHTNGHANVLRASRGSNISNTPWPEYSTSSPSSLHSSQPSFTSRSRSHSTSTTTTNLNAPPMSAGNPQTAFVKIKIFDRVTDDLIAIRVHPRVSHSELMTKIQARLGASISTLRYRDSIHHDFLGLESDQDLRDWLESAEKHVLYAD